MNTSPTNVSPRNMTGRETIAALFQDRAAAERAISDLKDAGFTGSEIGIAMRDRDAQGELVSDTGTQAAETGLKGAIGGGALGGVLGFLVGLGALAIPGVGPVVAGGLLASAFGIAGGTAVAGATMGATAGGIVGSLVGLGIPDDEAKYFEKGFHSGSVLVTVKAGGARVMNALAILERNGGDSGANLGTTGNAVV